MRIVKAALLQSKGHGWHVIVLPMLSGICSVGFAQGDLLKDVFPLPAATGRPPVDPRDRVDGILWRLLQRIVDQKRRDRLDKELWCVDGSVVRAARCAAGGGKKGTRTNQKITL
jgi:hypothetical protein